MFELPDQLMFLKNGRAKQKHSNESMQGKLCIVSGATSGVGYQAVKALANGGANIVMVVRNIEKAIAVKQEIEQNYSVDVDYYIADFSKLNQVKKAAKLILNDYSKIDVLINSVGIHSTKRMLNENGYEMVFCVNHLGSFLLTNLLLERLIESAPARIIQVNSEGHRFNGLDINDLNWERRIYTGLRRNGASKVEQLLTVWKFAERLKGTGVTINAMHPGGVRTNIGNNNGLLYRLFLHNITWHFLKNPKISGEALYYLASSKDLDNVSGKFYNLTIEEKPAKHALDVKLQKEIWEISLEMTSLEEKGE